MLPPARKIDFINIDSEGNYFDTKEQIQTRRVNYFVETTSASRVSGSNSVVGLMSRKRVVKDDNVFNSSTYLTSSTEIDSSGNERKILSSANDYLASSSIDSYRNGIEITQEKHWTAGVAKITAGTPGHLYDSLRFGHTSASDVLGLDTYFEIDVFNPISYIESHQITYPVITKNSNESENHVLNGIIEPFPIRPVIANFSINFPFEPHSTKGQAGNGNINWRGATDVVTSVEEFGVSKKNFSFFLDAADVKKMSSGNGDVGVGPAEGYFNMDENPFPFFEDKIYPRGVGENSSYDSDLEAALENLPPGGTTYVTERERSATCGFVYDQTDRGTDSIAYGGYKKNTFRKQNKSIIRERDNSSFISAGSEFNDLNTVTCNSQPVEYPSMIPSALLSSSVGLLSSSASALYQPGGIRIVRTIRPGMFDSSLKDSIILSERLMNS